MDKYRKVLKARIALLTLPILLALGLSIYNVFFASEAIKESFIFGFQSGASTALSLFSIFFMIRFSVILRDETKIKQQYNKENDERLKTIRAKAGLPMLQITSAGMIVVGIIMGYSNITVSITLFVAAMCQMMISVIIKQIYLRKV